ncbi:hypothetical protein VP02_22510 [Pseudomonas ogarae]|uniref:Uncharacterized protein n=1 Tax=Pseudomonas kilonensis TaxID=132476 RepID=A0A0F4XI46_9PSED|nr:hypothetical protein VP02_22510 [Pseudomonas ogarae]OPG70843.1 hypothetical protein B1219_11400 [Pseudomonas ogarae]OPG78057.1 hypothetical protein B1218_17685 [Pseudomonas ogarae]
MLGESQLDQNRQIAAFGSSYPFIAQTLIARPHRSKHNQQKASIWFIAGLQSFGTDPSHMTMQTSDP